MVRVLRAVREAGEGREVIKDERGALGRAKSDMHEEMKAAMEGRRIASGERRF